MKESLKNFQWYLDNLSSLLSNSKYYGNYLLISDCEVKGVGKSLDEVILLSRDLNLVEGSFIIQLCKEHVHEACIATPFFTN